MTKLEQLIKQICPNEVEYKKLGDIATDVFRGAGITRDQVTEEGTPCVRYGEIYTTYGIYFDTCVSHTDESMVQSKKYFEHGDILFAITGESVEDIAKSTAYVGHEKCLAGGDIVVLKHNQNPKYLSYVLSTTEVQMQKSKGKVKSKVVHSSVPAIKDIVIPVPPLEVQSEIVRILDNFTELTAELTAELTGRKKQYEYYRDMLLTFGDDVEYKPLGDIIISLKTGLNPRQNFSLNKNGSILPYITGKDIYDNAINITERTDKITPEALSLINKRAGLEKGLLLFASTGTGTVGRMAIIQSYDNDWGISETLYAIKVNEQIILTNFLMYYLYSSTAKNQFVPKISKGSVPHLKVKDLKDVKVPILPIEEQTRIVAILDRFDKLCNNISEGLPAEIEARRKQYEYYRDKLLSFEKINNLLD